MYRLRHTKLFQKSFKRLARSGDKKILQEVDIAITNLIQDESLSGKYHDHALIGEYLGYRECHIRPDVLLIYSIQKNEMVLEIFNIGSHSQLFD